MSGGAFILSRYEASYAVNIHPIKVQPETALAAIGATVNNPPAAVVDNPISCSVSRGNRQIGLRARLVRLTYTAANAPDGYDSRGGVIVIPALTETFYNAAIKGAAATYLTKPMTVSGRTPEVAL